MPTESQLLAQAKRRASYWGSANEDEVQWREARIGNKRNAVSCFPHESTGSLLNSLMDRIAETVQTEAAAD